MEGWPICALARSCPTLMRIPVYPFRMCWHAGTDSCFSDLFGILLNKSVLHATATAFLEEYRHNLPLVVLLCVKELYHTGEYGLSINLWLYNGLFL